MEIEEGEFVRTNKGYIFHNLSSKQISGLKLLSLQYGNIVKHSKQIIDLIEEGDYVNGYKIIMNLQKSKKHYNTENNFVTAVGYTFAEEEIKTILTNEQFEQNAFRLEE